MKVDINRFKIKQVYIDNIDLCSSCEYIGQCPLIRNLYNELVVLRYKFLRIDRCQMYTKKKKRA